MTAATAIVKALLVTTAFMPHYLQVPAPHSVTASLSGGRWVRLLADEKACELSAAKPEELPAVQAIAAHYADFLKGGNLPSAPAGVPTTHHIETAHEGGGLEVFELPEAKEPERLAALRNIVKESTAKVVEGVLVDLYSASTTVQIIDLLNEGNKAKILSLPITNCINACYRLMAGAQTRSASRK